MSFFFCLGFSFVVACHVFSFALSCVVLRCLVFLVDLVSSHVVPVFPKQPYLAPELVRDLPYDAGVDLWATGVVTYELLHGYTPFRYYQVAARGGGSVYLRRDPASRKRFYHLAEL